MARIAWIEDDARDIAEVVRPLERAGHAIDVYTNLRETVERADDLKTSDLLLLDILLPSGDPLSPTADLSAGLNLLLKLRQLGVSAPAVVFSARSQRQHESELTPEMDIRDWVQKPVSRYVLAARVEAVLQSSA